MEVRVWVNGAGGGGRERDLTPSPLWKCHAPQEPCYPPRAGNALREAILNDSGNMHLGFALTWLEHVPLPTCVLCTTPSCMSAHALRVLFIAFPKSPLHFDL